MKIAKTCLAATFAVLALPLLVAPASAQLAIAELKDAGGKVIGNANLAQTQAGVLITLKVTGISPGEHAFHVHATGKCEPPFTSACLLYTSDAADE